MKSALHYLLSIPLSVCVCVNDDDDDDDGGERSANIFI